MRAGLPQRLASWGGLRDFGIFARDSGAGLRDCVGRDLRQAPAGKEVGASMLSQKAVETKPLGRTDLFPDVGPGPEKSGRPLHKRLAVPVLTEGHGPDVFRAAAEAFLAGSPVDNAEPPAQNFEGDLGALLSSFSKPLPDLSARTAAPDQAESRVL